MTKKRHKKMFCQAFGLYSTNFLITIFNTRSLKTITFKIIFHFLDCGVPSVPHSSGNKETIDVTIKQQPWLVSLGHYNNPVDWVHLCAGSLITNKHVLTAALCYGKDQREKLEKGLVIV